MVAESLNPLKKKNAKISRIALLALAWQSGCGFSRMAWEMNFG